MTDSRAHAAYYESEAALRLVDQELDQLRDGPAADDPRLDAVRVSDLPVILERANGQIHAVLSQMRDTRQVLQCTSFTMLRNTHAKIQEVTVATEDAAIDILDACDRASHIVDELDAIDAVPSPDRGKAQRLRATLRDELFMMMGALQFQDITAQQLAHAFPRRLPAAREIGDGVERIGRDRPFRVRAEVTAEKRRAGDRGPHELRIGAERAERRPCRRVGLLRGAGGVVRIVSASVHAHRLTQAPPPRGVKTAPPGGDAGRPAC